MPDLAPITVQTGEVDTAATNRCDRRWMQSTGIDDLTVTQGDARHTLVHGPHGQPTAETLCSNQGWQDTRSRHFGSTKTKSHIRRCGFLFGAGNETRTRDPDLGKVVLYQMSYFRLYKNYFLECENKDLAHTNKKIFYLYSGLY